jgi:FkbM family methyltransferase
MRKFIRNILNKFGYDIIKLKYEYKIGVQSAENIQLLREEFQWMREYGFKTIVDVGANEGQFSEKARLLFPEANIYAFEPLPEAYQRLKNNFTEDGYFHCFNVGVGEQKATLEIHLNESSASSSILPLGGLHKEAFEDAKESKSIAINIDTLDSLLPLQGLQFPMLLKVDVQGYEDKVLKGATNFLGGADMIIIELTFKELYEGQPLFDNIYTTLVKQGYAFEGVIEQLRNPKTNEILQADGVFVKKVPH